MFGRKFRQGQKALPRYCPGRDKNLGFWRRYCCRLGSHLPAHAVLLLSGQPPNLDGFLPLGKEEPCSFIDHLSNSLRCCGRDVETSQSLTFSKEMGKMQEQKWESVDPVKYC